MLMGSNSKVWKKPRLVLCILVFAFVLYNFKKPSYILVFFVVPLWQIRLRWIFWIFEFRQQHQHHWLSYQASLVRSLNSKKRFLKLTRRSFSDRSVIANVTENLCRSLSSLPYISTLYSLLILVLKFKVPSFYEIVQYFRFKWWLRIIVNWIYAKS